MYRLFENQLKDIVKSQGYYDIISPFLEASNPNYSLNLPERITGFYNNIYNEYWLQINTVIDVITGTPQLPIITPTPKTETFTFSQNTDRWQSTFDYRFDKYIQIENKLLGSRGLGTYELDKGFVINGTDIELVLMQNTTPLRGSEMEFIRIQIDSDNKPTKVEFLDSDYTVLSTLDQASKGPLKNSGTRFIKDFKFVLFIFIKFLMFYIMKMSLMFF